MADSPLRDFVYLDADRVRSIAAQLDVPVPAGGADDRAARETLFRAVEPTLVSRPGVLRVAKGFDFQTWRPDTFADGALVVGTGVVRLLDFNWLSLALGGLPAVLKKMSKLEMEALRNSDEGRRMSKTALQQRSQENQVAISRVEEFKADELGEVVRKLYGDVIRVKLRPDPEAQPACVLVASAYVQHFADAPSALAQKYGIDIDAGWTMVGQVNQPNPTAAAQPAGPLPVGNKIEDSFEQIAVLMNNAFRLSTAPLFPSVSVTPLAIYRTVR